MPPHSFVPWGLAVMQYVLSECQSVVVSSIWELLEPAVAPYCPVHKIPSSPTLHRVSVPNEVALATKNLDWKQVPSRRHFLRSPHKY